MARTSSRKINGKGGFTIPKTIRGELKLEGKFMRIEHNDQGQIIMTPFSIDCTFCGATDVQVVLKGKGICPACLNSLKGKRSKTK